MIFVPFVENAFKHGVSATLQSHIEISVKQDNNLLYLDVKNSIINDNSVSLDTNSGIGLVNTRRRLDLYIIPANTSWILMQTECR